MGCSANEEEEDSLLVARVMTDLYLLFGSIVYEDCVYLFELREIKGDDVPGVVFNVIAFIKDPENKNKCLEGAIK